MVAADQFVGDSLYFPRGAEAQIKFSCGWPSTHADARNLFSYNLLIEGQNHPFIQHDQVHLDGFHDAGQFRRIKVNTTKLQNAFFVNLTIANVTTGDSGTYILTTKLYLHPNYLETYVRNESRRITVTVPPYKAQCAITLSQNKLYLYIITCTALPADRSYLNVARISCFIDSGDQIPKNITIRHDNVSAVFGVQSHLPVACCSHETYEDPPRNCQDFVWPFQCSEQITSFPCNEETCPATTTTSDALALRACFTFAAWCLLSCFLPAALCFDPG